ncbi:MAG: NDMA-dependent alcohol dehydrogenase [Actinobacteria bacterium]|nr:NDMA-dependent alcohol dehydrogenase [Actinomycetota bacterium]
MRTRGALLINAGTNSGFTVTELELGAPKDGEVLVELVAAGLCHSDYHYDTGDGVLSELPLLLGHEGAGVVREVGAGVTKVAPGDHVITSFMPSCGQCRWCTAGRGNLCDRGAELLSGKAMDGTHRVHTTDGQPVFVGTYTGTFAEHVVCPQDSLVRVEKDVPLDKVVLVACGVPTGWGSAVTLAEVEPGDVVCVIGCGGVGMNAVQGARYAGAKTVIAIDPVAWKREIAIEEFGATHAAASIEEAQELVTSLTRGVGADRAIITVGVVDGEMIDPALALISKGGVLAISSVSAMTQTDAKLSLFAFVLYEKQIRGGLYGKSAPNLSIPKLVDLYRRGDLKLDQLVTNTYTLGQINEGYADMMSGKNLRGVVLY